MLDQGLWAEVKVANEHLRLFAECNALGAQASVFNVNYKTWIAPSEPVDDIEHGNERRRAPRNIFRKWQGHNFRRCSGKRRDQPKVKNGGGGPSELVSLSALCKSSG